ncbi:MAG TPA: GNAT family N-acetyltransferase [bacterium]|nr:GNAT family N-acetyltransferase [bacterium]
MEQFQFIIDVNPDAREVQSLNNRIDTFNVEETRIYDFKELAIFLRDSTRQLIAGVYAFTWGGCLDIRSVWVREDLRGAGIGSKLMDAVEREAIRRGCRIATLETHSFQAPRFYERLGYEEIGVLDGYPIGHKKHYLRKLLST